MAENAVERKRCSRQCRGAPDTIPRRSSVWRLTSFPQLQVERDRVQEGLLGQSCGSLLCLWGDGAPSDVLPQDTDTTEEVVCYCCVSVSVWGVVVTLTLYTRVHVLLRITGNNNAHAFPLYTAASVVGGGARDHKLCLVCPGSSKQTTQRQGSRVGAATIFERRFLLYTKTLTARPICCSYRRSYGAANPFVCVKRYNRPAVALSKRQPLDRRKKAGSATSNGRLPRSAVEDKAFLW